jgi:DNA-binding NtrC family response regulator
MRAEELDHKELLELDSEGGIIRFAGQRALLLDAVAMGLLRKYLVENFGLTAARTVLTQFGFAHGWRMAEAMQAKFEWDSEADWRHACTRIHTLEGLFRVESESMDPSSKEGVMLVASYEAEQHLLHFGRADSPMCWTICGLISGYLSRTAGREIYVLEDRCLGKGDAGCHLLGRTREEWGDERAEELHFYQPERLKDCLDISLHRVTETLKAAERKLRERRRALVAVAPEIDEPLGSVARSPAMCKLVDLARRLAKVDTTVLITGESGTGKERIARFMHDQSTRASGPFIAVNCGAITETLLESELFGHARGAFTGAAHDRPGLFEAANRGTLLLDEVGEVSPGMQVKLLRALQEREIRRVGENKVRPIDVRVVAATNRDLEAAIREREFREDLYYRLSVVVITLPPLRHRREDLPDLVNYFLQKYGPELGNASPSIHPEAMSFLQAQQWPGNVRELENVVRKALLLAQSYTINLDHVRTTLNKSRVPLCSPARALGDVVEDLLAAARRGEIAGAHARVLEFAEREVFARAIAQANGNQAKAARWLGISRVTMKAKLVQFGLHPAQGQEPGPE